MNIALIGYGKMGKVVEKIAKERGHTIKAIIDPTAEGATHKKIDENSLNGVDVCIEFALPQSTLPNIKNIAACKKNAVIATTAWYDQLDKAKEIVEKKGIGVIYSPNFSIGVNIFFRIIKNAGGIFKKFSDYSVNISETHHVHKLDAPSGTAKKIGEILEEEMGIDKIDIESIREGEIPGIHVVNFDSEGDYITLKHSAKSREGFALGSVLAAEWIKGKKGIYSIEDMMDEIIR